MQIGELGEQLGVNPKNIRYYESIGLLPEPARSASGYRLYDETDVERLRFIKAAQRLGLALDEVREILALRDGGQAPCAYVRTLTSREVADIDQRWTSSTGSGASSSPWSSGHRTSPPMGRSAA